jgi:hypothetical protein
MLPRLGSDSLSDRDKELTDDLFHLSWLHTMPQNSTPRTVVRHLLSFEMKELTQLLGSQPGPMSHAATAILPS